MITGKILRDALISGSNCLANCKVMVDELNVFPVPDGDTGTNMSMTMTAAALELSMLDDSSDVETVSKTASSSLLRGARGNSGVILSLVFRGFSKALVGKEDMGTQDLANALNSGISAAYKAVMKPTEGTMLTVVRECAEQADDFAELTQDVAEFWAKICDAALVSLDNTPNLLPVLKKAGVVDAGGMGMLKIFDGMKSVFETGMIIELSDEEQVSSNPEFGFGVEDEEVDIEFPYCTEFIVVKEPCDLSLDDLRNFLDSLGNSLVFVEDDEIIKVHVHTKDPGAAFSAGIKYGHLINMKVDNMVEQFNKKSSKKIVEQAAKKSGSEFKYAPVDPSNQYGFVGVAAGSGICDLFSELGVDCIVSGGQTMNPSTDDILAGVHSVPAKTVFVLPNNKNIIMAAEQTVPLADREVIVLQTRTIPQGISAMLSFDPDLGAEENLVNMRVAYDAVQTGLITYAARDSEYDGKKITKGEILALENGKVSFSDKDLVKSTAKLVKNLTNKNTTFITLIYGDNVDEATNELVVEAISAKIDSSIEINVIPGNQPVYHYIISVE